MNLGDPNTYCKNEDALDGEHCFHCRDADSLLCCWCGDLFEPSPEERDPEHGPHAPEPELVVLASGEHVPLTLELMGAKVALLHFRAQVARTVLSGKVDETLQTIVSGAAVDVKLKKRRTEMDTAIAQEIDDERRRQDKQWGGPSHDDEHHPRDWLDFIDKQLRFAAAADVRREETPPSQTEARHTAEYRERLVRIAALAVAAMESFDRQI